MIGGERSRAPVALGRPEPEHCASEHSLPKRSHGRTRTDARPGAARTRCPRGSLLVQLVTDRDRDAAARAMGNGLRARGAARCFRASFAVAGRSCASRPRVGRPRLRMRPALRSGRRSQRCRRHRRAIAVARRRLVPPPRCSCPRLGAIAISTHFPPGSSRCVICGALANREGVRSRPR